MTRQPPWRTALPYALAAAAAAAALIGVLLSAAPIPPWVVALTLLALAALGARQLRVLAEEHALSDALEARVAERSAALDRSRARLAETDRMEAVGRMAAGVAHDMNNMLGVVVASAGLLRLDKPGPGALTAALQPIDEALASAERLVARLQAFGRRTPPGSERLDPAARLLAMRPLLESVGGARVRVEVRVLGAPGPVRLGADQLEQLAVNLVANARDASPAGGQVWVELEDHLPSDDGFSALLPQAVLRVRDQGSGMDSATLDRLFEPFFTTKPSGTGLGLASSHGIVAAAGGRIRVESRPGVGTTFEVWLPVAR